MRRIQTGALFLALALLFGCRAPENGEPIDGNLATVESQRIYEHLSRVESELRSRSPAHLSPAQRDARARALDWLHEYRNARTYPHNHVLPDRHTPVFVDPHGTPCAVGYLLLRSGESELVRDVAEHENLATVLELADDPRLRDWLDRYGLTVEEATRIQPGYGPGRPWVPPDGAAEEKNTYRNATLALTAASGALTVYNTRTRPTGDGIGWSGALSLATGAAHAALVLEAATGDDDRPGWAVGLNQMAGIVSVVSGWNRLNGGETETSRASRVDVDPIAAFGPDRTVLGVRVAH